MIVLQLRRRAFILENTSYINKIIFTRKLKVKVQEYIQWIFLL
jgi:hypothetical protein